MAPTFSFLISSGSKKERRYECLSEAKALHSYKTWTEVSSSVPHFLQIGLSLSHITYRCHLRVLCPVRRPQTTLGCALLKDNNQALVNKSGLEINSQVHLWVLQGPCHVTKYCLSIQHLVFLLKAKSHIACRATKGLECVFPIWFTQCGHIWFTPAMPCSNHAGHGTAQTSRDSLWGSCPHSASSGYHAEFHEDCYQKHTNPPHNDPYLRL